jgi:YbgC/YbaW family acyl-CoA thioester hydrolase
VSGELEYTPPENSFVFPLHAISLEKFDIGGVLHHANYFHLLEQAREAFLALRGIPYPQLVSQGSHLAIVSSQQQFIKPIYYGEPIDIAVWCSELKRSTVTLKYLLIHDRDSSAVHLAETKLAFVTKGDTQFKAARMPEMLLKSFEGILDGKQN